MLARVQVPRSAKRGEVIEIRIAIQHPMETGYRRDAMGAPVPRDIITKFTCSYGGVEVFSMDLYTGVAANPFVAFHTIATETGDLTFTWTDQHGQSLTEVHHLDVS